MNISVEQMTLAEIEDYELKRMGYNAFKVCDDLTCRIDAAPAPDRYMKAYTSQKNEDLFFNDHLHLNQFISATERDINSMPGYHYFKKS
jgi:hypothetical protein